MFRLSAITDEISTGFERALDLIGEWGLEDVEIHTLWGTSVEALTSEQVTGLCDVLAERRLRVAALDSTAFLRCRLRGGPLPESWSKRFHSIAGDIDQHLTMLGRCLETARLLDAPLVRIFGFWGDGELHQHQTQHDQPIKSSVHGVFITHLSLWPVSLGPVSDRAVVGNF